MDIDILSLYLNTAQIFPCKKSDHQPLALLLLSPSEQIQIYLLFDPSIYILQTY